MKVINGIKKAFLWLFGIVFFIFAIGLTIILLSMSDSEFGVATFGETVLIPVKEDVSSELYEKGDLVLLETREIDEIETGDELFIFQVDSDAVVKIDVGIIDEVIADENIVTFENGSAYDIDFVAGSATKVYDNLGFYYSILLSKWGFLFIVLIPCLLIFISQVYALIVEVRYGEEKTV